MAIQSIKLNPKSLLTATNYYIFQ